MVVVNSWWEIRIFCYFFLEEIVFWWLEKFGCLGIFIEKKVYFLFVCGYLFQEKVEIFDLVVLVFWCEQDVLLFQVFKFCFYW